MYRPILAEVQCLVSYSPAAGKAGPRRAADGFPLQRLLLICAVIEKRLKISLYARDIYLNVAGGLRISEPSSDLAVAISIISSALGAKVKPG
jgi:DNA repair protein RadA/Sms